MFEPVHAFGELEIYPSVVYILIEVVFINDVLRDVSELDACVLGPVQWCVEVEIGEIHCHVFSARCGKGAVDYKFDGLQRCCFCTTIAGVVDCVTPDGDASSIDFFFIWFYLTHYARVCYIRYTILWDVVEVDWAHGVCSLHTLFTGDGWMDSSALTQTSELISVRSIPSFFVFG